VDDISDSDISKIYGSLEQIPDSPDYTAPVALKIADTPVYRFVEHMPEFPGDINQYLAANIRYPKEARDRGIEGRIVIEFVVDTDGRVTKTKILQHIDPFCDAEALRVIRQMPRWKPGTTKEGLPVKTYFTLPITFRVQ